MGKVNPSCKAAPHQDHPGPRWKAQRRSGTGTRDAYLAVRGLGLFGRCGRHHVPLLHFAEGLGIGVVLRTDVILGSGARRVVPASQEMSEQRDTQEAREQGSKGARDRYGQTGEQERVQYLR